MRLKRTLELQFRDQAPTGQRTDRWAQEPMIGSIGACLPIVSHPFPVPLLAVYFDCPKFKNLARLHHALASKGCEAN
jgi:hypothetical protein